MQERTLIIGSIFFALLFVGSAFLFRQGSGTGSQAQANLGANTRPTIAKTKVRPVPGKEGAEHSHASFILFIEDDVIDFAQARYMLRSKLAHFENGDGLTVHKHTTGITLPYFLSTLGITLAHTCLKLDTEERYCVDATKKIRLLANGREVEDFDYYEIRDNDRLLLDYGADGHSRLQLKMNHVPAVGKEFKKPF